MRGYCRECGCKLSEDENKICDECYNILLTTEEPDEDNNQDENLGGTGHGDISWSDADGGL